MAAEEPTNPWTQRDSNREQTDGSAAGAPGDHSSFTPLHRLHLWQIQAVRDLFVIMAIVGLVWLGYALRAITIPLLVALLLAYLFEPVIDRLIRSPRFHLSRLHAVVFLLFTVIGGLAIILALVVPLAVGQTAKLVSNFNDGTMRIHVEGLVTRLPEGLDEEFESFIHIFPEPRGRIITPEIRNDITEEAGESTDETESENPADEENEGSLPQEGGGDVETLDDETTRALDTDDLSPIDEARIREIVGEEIAAASVPPSGSLVSGAESRDLWALGRQGLKTVLDVLGAAAAIGLLIFLIPFYFFFFAMSYPKVVRFFRQLIPERNKPRALDLIAKMDRVVSGFVRGRFVIAALMGLMLSAGWILCGVPYALLLGLIAGVFSLVPYLVGLALPIAIGMLFFAQMGTPEHQRDIVFGWVGVFFWPTLVWLIVQFIETYILTPKIAGKAAGLDPVTVVVAVLAGGALMGVYGMLLAIPLAACIKILITDVLAPRVDQWLKGERPDPLPIERGD
jgi:predicted PurR-regulated permease PerM